MTTTLPLPPAYLETFDFIMSYDFTTDEVATHLIEQHDIEGAFEIASYAVQLFNGEGDVYRYKYWKDVLSRVQEK